MSPAASRAFERMLANEVLHVGAGPRGKSVRRSTARELLDAGICDWTDFDNRGDRPGFETVSDLRIYLPQCDGCHKRFALNTLRRYEDYSLCVACSVAMENADA